MDNLQVFDFVCFYFVVFYFVVGVVYVVFQWIDYVDVRKGNDFVQYVEIDVFVIGYFFVFEYFFVCVGGGKFEGIGIIVVDRLVSMFWEIFVQESWWFGNEYFIVVIICSDQYQFCEQLFIFFYVLF